VDTAGQSDYLHRLDAHLQDCHGAVVVFSLDSLESWTAVAHEFLPRIRRAYGSAPENDFMSPLVVVGAKLDLIQTPADRVVDFDEAEEFVRSEGGAYFEISSRENVNVSEAFLEAARKVRDFRRRSAKTTPMLPIADLRNGQERIEEKFKGFKKIRKKAKGWLSRRRRSSVDVGAAQPATGSSAGLSPVVPPFLRSPSGSLSEGSPRTRRGTLTNGIGRPDGVMQRQYSIPASELDFGDQDELGKGGFGVVRKAIWLKTCVVAVKTINQVRTAPPPTIVPHDSSRA
jgi:Ras family